MVGKVLADLRKNWRLSLLALVCIALALTAALSGRRAVIVVGDSMYPTYSDGDRLPVTGVSERTLGSNHPVCWVQLPSGDNIIKRLIGYPGQIVELHDGDTYVDGELIMQRSGNSWDNCIWRLEEGQYLFLGDNRENSLDARFWDPYYVTIDSICGVVLNSGLR